MLAKKQRNIRVGVIIFFALLFLVDRYYWAQLPPWREDASTNIWLGFTRGIGNIPVGLISSRKLPNPNGMPLLAVFLSTLPNLLTISFFLGVTQILCIILVGWKTSGKHWQFFLLATLPALSSVVLRAISVEFWNQYTITLLNLLFIFWALRYLENASLWNLPPIATLILLAPSIYLAGIVNAMAMTLLMIGMMVYKRPNMRNFWSASIIILLLVLLSVWITWQPYFHEVSLGQIIEESRIKADPVSSFPLAFKQGNLKILSLATQIMLKITNIAYTVQVIFAITAFLYLLFANFLKEKTFRNWKGNTNSSLVQVVVISGLFFVLSYTFSALLGGADWLHNQRPDQTVQFLPMFLFFIFCLPVSIPKSGNVERIVNSLSNILLGIFVTINLLCGFLIIRDHLQYRGNVLTDADVPLTDKMQVVKFIANDWKSHSTSSVIAVDYDLAGRWTWVPKFGLKLDKWYPAPMTQGRSFDYELLHRYGLTNAQEGIQLRTFGDGRYLVSYAFEPPPQIENREITNYIFGRLRVSIVDK